MIISITYNNNTNLLKVAKHWFCKLMNSLIKEFMPIRNLKRYWIMDYMFWINPCRVRELLSPIPRGQDGPYLSCRPREEYLPNILHLRGS